MFVKIGSKVQNFLVQKKIGEGGMGEVYLAEEDLLERHVALKVLNPLLTNDPQFTSRFINEARVQSQLHHPNIVTLYSFFNFDNLYYMSMEYAAGRTLKQVIRETGPIPEARSLKILKQILEALDYAHQKNIIHRDIKPSNIMIDSQDRVKIMDFGIAKIIGDKQLTKTGAKVGTIFYMSPEQVKAQKDIDLRSDIFSLGVTFYEMLTGRLPYDDNTESDFEIMSEIVNNQLPDPRKIYPYISDNTVDINFKMVEKDRELRFDNCRQIIDAIDNIKRDDRKIDVTVEKEERQERQEPPNAVQDNKKDPLYGVKGWLGLYCGFTMFVTLISAINLIYFNFLSLLIHLFGLSAVILLIKKNKLGVLFTKISLWINMFLNFYGFFDHLDIYDEPNVFCLIGIVSGIMWLLYFSKSKRVKVTYNLKK